MHFRITGDIDSESGLEQIILDFSGPAKKHFLLKEYGNGLSGIVVVLMCQSSSLNLKKRLRFAKDKKTLYLDIMLDLVQMRQASSDSRRKIVLEQLVEKIPADLRKFSISDFDEKHFIEDLNVWCQSWNGKESKN